MRQLEFASIEILDEPLAQLAGIRRGKVELPATHSQQQITPTQRGKAVTDGF